MPQPESESVRVLRQFRVQMDALDESVVNDLATRWLEIEVSLQKDMMILAQEFERRAAAGETITEQMIYKSRHYQILNAQVEKEVAKYNKDFAIDAISTSQERAAILGVNAATESIYASYPSAISANFDKLNIKAVESLIGFAGDGTPLKKLLDKAAGDASDGIVQAMLAGIGKGDSAFAIAKAMAGDGLSLGLDRALLISRTESNRAYRSGSIQQYRESGVVTGFYRLVSKGNACLGCLMRDGEFLELASDLEDHPNGACTAVAQVRGMEPPQWEKGKDWLLNQNEARQREILGGTRFDLWKGGMPLESFSGMSHSKVWGDAPMVVPIRDLMK